MLTKTKEISVLAHRRTGSPPPLKSEYPRKKATLRWGSVFQLWAAGKQTLYIGNMALKQQNPRRTGIDRRWRC
jgi:hypothetical protein